METHLTNVYQSFFNRLHKIIPLAVWEEQHLTQGLTYRTIHSGETLITTGRINNVLYFVVEGCLRQYYWNEDNQSVTIDFITADTFCVCHHTLYTGKLSADTIEAVTDCELLAIDYSYLSELFENSLNLNLLARKILEKAVVKRDEQIARLSQLNARQRHSWFRENFKEVYVQARLQDVASFLGMKPETLSRLRRRSF